MGFIGIGMLRAYHSSRVTCGDLFAIQVLEKIGKLVLLRLLQGIVKQQLRHELVELFGEGCFCVVPPYDVMDRVAIGYGFNDIIHLVLVFKLTGVFPIEQQVSVSDGKRERYQFVAGQAFDHALLDFFAHMLYLDAIAQVECKERHGKDSQEEYAKGAAHWA